MNHSQQSLSQPNVVNMYCGNQEPTLKNSTMSMTRLLNDHDVELFAVQQQQQLNMMPPVPPSQQIRASPATTNQYNSKSATNLEWSKLVQTATKAFESEFFMNKLFVFCLNVFKMCFCLFETDAHRSSDSLYYSDLAKNEANNLNMNAISQPKLFVDF